MLFEEASGGVNLVPQSHGLRMIEKWLPGEQQGAGSKQREHGYNSTTRRG